MERWGKKSKKNEVENRPKRKAKESGDQGKKKQQKITAFIIGNTIQSIEPVKKRPRPEERRKVTRTEILTEVLEITKIQNIEGRERSEKRWGREEIRQYGNKKKKTKSKKRGIYFREGQS